MINTMLLVIWLPLADDNESNTADNNDNSTTTTTTNNDNNDNNDNADRGSRPGRADFEAPAAELFEPGLFSLRLRARFRGGV